MTQKMLKFFPLILGQISKKVSPDFWHFSRLFFGLNFWKIFVAFFENLIVKTSGKNRKISSAKSPFFLDASIEKKRKIGRWKIRFFPLVFTIKFSKIVIKIFQKFSKKLPKNAKNRVKNRSEKNLRFLTSMTQNLAPPGFRGILGVPRVRAAGFRVKKWPFFLIFGRKLGQKGFICTFPLKNLIPSMGHIFSIFRVVFNSPRAEIWVPKSV